jgi:hypothetical protein
MEMINLYEVLLRQSAILKNVENGGYSSGIKGVNIPILEKRKINLPTREKYSELYKSIEKSKYLFSQNSNHPNSTKAKTQYLKNWHKTHTSKTTGTLSPQDRAALVRSEEDRWRPIVDPPTTLLEKLGKKELEIYCSDLLGKWKFGSRKEAELLNTVDSLGAITREAGVGDIRGVGDEVLKYKRMYEEELKKSMSGKAAIEKGRKTIMRVSGSVAGNVRVSTTGL